MARAAARGIGGSELAAYLRGLGGEPAHGADQSALTSGGALRMCAGGRSDPLEYSGYRPPRSLVLLLELPTGWRPEARRAGASGKGRGLGGEGMGGEARRGLAVAEGEAGLVRSFDARAGAWRRYAFSAFR